VDITLPGHGRLDISLVQVNNMRALRVMLCLPSTFHIIYSNVVRFVGSG
jgi:hypothetical protein